MTWRTRKHIQWSLCCLLLLPFALASLHAQSPGQPGPLHMQTEHQDLENLLDPEASNHKVATAGNLINIAVDPTDGRNAVVLAPSAFYVTSDGSRRWSTDFVPFLGEYAFTDPYDITQDTFQFAVGVSFDRSGHTFVALQDPIGQYNQGTGNQVAVAEGTNHGRYLNNVPVVAASGACGSFYGYCDEQLTVLGIVTDLSGTATDGSTYIYYLVRCQNYGPGCDFGYGGTTALFATVTKGAGQPFTSISLVSTLLQFLNVGGASAVVDSTGTPHFIYIDLTRNPTIDLILDQAYFPLLQYSEAGQYNPHFNFPGGFASSTPNCAGHGEMAYCAFNAGSIGTGAPQTNINVYLATIDLQAGTATVSQVNDDPAGKGKDHFNPSVTVTPNGDVFVGFFDDRRHVADNQLDYFLARSTDGGKTFSKQEPINDVSFPAVLGTPPETYNPAFTGSIASAPDGVVHAAWTDTRNRTNVQVYSRDVKW